VGLVRWIFDPDSYNYSILSQSTYCTHFRPVSMVCSIYVNYSAAGAVSMVCVVYVNYSAAGAGAPEGSHLLSEQEQLQAGEGPEVFGLKDCPPHQP